LHTLKRDEHSSPVIQVVIQVKALEETFTYIVRQIWLFNRRVHEINRPLGRVQDHSAIVTARKMLLQFLAKLWGQLAVNILRQRSQQSFTIRMEMVDHFIFSPHG
jgi:hypothetical protein